MNNDWTDEELRAAVDVYVEMLQNTTLISLLQKVLL